MKYIAIILTVFFLGMALFGFTWMNHDMGGMGTGHMSACPLAALLSFGCTLDAISMTMLHLSAFLSFSSAIPVFSALLVLTLLVIVAISVAVFRHRLIFVPEQNFIRKFYQTVPKPASTIKFFAWLALFENSPTFSMR